MIVGFSGIHLAFLNTIWNTSDFILHYIIFISFHVFKFDSSSIDKLYNFHRILLEMLSYLKVRFVTHG